MSDDMDPLLRLEAELKSLQPRRTSAGLSDSLRRRLPPKPARIGRFPWASSHLKWAAAAVVVIATAVLHPTYRQNPLPGPQAAVSAPLPERTLASGWRIQPTGQAVYQVLKPELLRLERGELFVASVPLADATATRSPLKIETPNGTAIAKGTQFIIGSHAPSINNNPHGDEEMKTNHLTRVLVLTGLVTLTNAHGEAAATANQLLVAETGKAPVAHAVAANSQFALDLYGALARENPGQNLFFSPYSMSSALAMTAEGARGETAAQMGKVLGFPEAARHVGDDAQLLPWNTALIHTGMAELQERFNPRPVPQELRDQIAVLRAEHEASKKQHEAFHSAQKWAEGNAQRETTQKLAGQLVALSSQVDQYELRVANALYGEKTYPFRQAYLDTISKFYGTGAAVPVDFKNDFEAVRGQINTWVERQTHQRIKDLIAKGGLDGYTRLVLVNAIYFKGDWAIPFDAKNTKEEEFLAPGSKVPVPMMRQDEMRGLRYGAFNADGSFFPTPDYARMSQRNDAFMYPKKDGFLMAELPYKGNELSMVVMVPQDANGIGELEKKLSNAHLQAWLGKLQDRRAVNLQMPKFKLETDYQDMKQTLQAMGMTRAFNDPRDPGKGAQFDGMSDRSDPMRKLYITKVCHKAFVEVTEQGTEAAAATAVIMAVPMSSDPAVPFTPTFRADKPFLFAIRDVKTGTILFLGRIVNPTK